MRLGRDPPATDEEFVGVEYVHRRPVLLGECGGETDADLAGCGLVDGEQKPMEHDRLLIL
jgi:hypothetical protein